MFPEPPTTKVAGFLGLVLCRELHYQATPVVPTVLIYTSILQIFIVLGYVTLHLRYLQRH